MLTPMLIPTAKIARRNLTLKLARYIAQRMKFSIEDFFSKCDQIRSFLQIWLHLLQKSLMENFIFCAVYIQVFWRFKKILRK